MYWLATRHFYGVNYFRTLTLSLLRTDPLFLFPLPPSSFIPSWIKASNSSFFCGESSGLERRSSIIQFPTHGRLSARSLSTFRVQAALRSVCQQQRQMVWKRTRPCEVTGGGEAVLPSGLHWAELACQLTGALVAPWIEDLPLSVSEGPFRARVVSLSPSAHAYLWGSSIAHYIIHYILYMYICSPTDKSCYCRKSLFALVSHCFNVRREVSRDRDLQFARLTQLWEEGIITYYRYPAWTQTEVSALILSG